MSAHRVGWSGGEQELLADREWLVTNGLGGYASGTVGGACTRRYHGLLVAALAAPLGRRMMLDHLTERVRLPDGEVVQLSAEERPGRREPDAALPLTQFHLELGLPVWTYRVGEHELEKRVWLRYRRNTVHVLYRLLAGPGRVRLRLRPSMHFRGHDDRVDGEQELEYQISADGGRYEVWCRDLPPLRLHLGGAEAALIRGGGHQRDLLYRVERSRGYEDRGPVWTPGAFRAELAAGEELALCASTESWDDLLAVDAASALAAELERRRGLLQQADPCARSGIGAELVLAADQFLITPATRAADAAGGRAAGDEPRSVIAGYHWFTDWSRDAMISLEGLTAVTGRLAEAGTILRTFARYLRDGLLPNHFPEGESQALYHTADATLWYFHAIDRYLQASGDRATLRALLPHLREIVHRHLEGTRFGIRVDPTDGLLTQGEEGYQLTWMDAKVGDRVITPRRGKAVELNALWYNALRLLEQWLAGERDEDGAARVREHAERARRSFNRRFWNAERGCLLDVVDGEEGDDPALRPNQLLAVSLPHPVLEEERWAAVVDAVERHLLTPVGLRSLAPDEPRYQPRCDGDLRARDAAYHQGTVWAWLIGPFVDAWLRVHPGRERDARDLLSGLLDQLGEACIGTLSEIFDAEAPFAPRGCVAQAWSVAEVLRCFVRTCPAG